MLNRLKVDQVRNVVVSAGCQKGLIDVARVAVVFARVVEGNWGKKALQLGMIWLAQRLIKVQRKRGAAFALHEPFHLLAVQKFAAGLLVSLEQAQIWLERNPSRQP